jgi:hypothetical protein
MILPFVTKYRGLVRFEVSLYNLYITNKFQTTFTQEGGEVKSVNRGVYECKVENSEDFCPNYVQEFGI